MNIKEIFWREDFFIQYEPEGIIEIENEKFFKDFEDARLKTRGVIIGIELDLKNKKIVLITNAIEE